jgi:hypothetical protein
MADIAEVLANYDALVGVALGAGLTYGFGALNRRQQERREDKTRWYQARLEAYAEFYRALYDGWLLAGDERTEADYKAFVSRLTNALGLIHLVGSVDVTLIAQALFKEALRGEVDDDQTRLAVFVFAARKDLGDTLDRSIQKEIDRALPPLGEDD